MNILFEDKDLLVTEKPAGIPVETKRIGLADMVSLLKNHLAAENGKPPYLGLIHRLDQPVQGVMVFAKNPKAAAHLSAQMSKGEMNKTYLAVVIGKAKEKDALCDFLLKDGRANTSRIVPPGTKGAKEARLEYERLAVCNYSCFCRHSNSDRNSSLREHTTGVLPSPPSIPLSLVRIHLFTGRHHQIRVQMAHAGFPLYGDQRYNPSPIGSTIALCACELTFRHPATGKKMTFSITPAGEIYHIFHEPE